MTAPVRVYGTYLSADGKPMTGSVTFHPDVVAADDTPGTALVSQQVVVARLDSFGYFEVNLTASDDDGWRGPPMKYVVDERIPGVRRQRLVLLPAPGPHDLNVLADEAPAVRSSGRQATGRRIVREYR